MIRRPDDAVDRGLARAVAVVEQVLALGVVDRDHRELQLALLLHRPQADDARGRLLHAGDDPLGVVLSLHVHLVDQVGPVVERDDGLVVDGRVDVVVVDLAVLAPDGEDRDAEILDQRGRHVVLRAQRVRRAQHRVRAAILERSRQVGRLGRDVQARGNIHALQRLGPRKPLANLPQDRHVVVRPQNPSFAFLRQCQIGYVIFHCHSFLFPSQTRNSIPPPVPLQSFLSLIQQTADGHRSQPSSRGERPSSISCNGRMG